MPTVEQKLEKLEIVVKGLINAVNESNDLNTKKLKELYSHSSVVEQRLEKIEDEAGVKSKKKQKLSTPPKFPKKSWRALMSDDATQ